MVVVLDPLLQPLLFEDDAVVNAGNLALVAAGAGQHLAMIGLGPPGQRGQQVVADGANVQLVHLAAAAGREQCHQPVVGQLHFLAGVEVVIGGRGFDPAARPPADPIQQVVGGDQVLVDGVAEVGQIDAAERPVPVAAVALAAIKLDAGLLDQLALGPGLRRLAPIAG